MSSSGTKKNYEYVLLSEIDVDQCSRMVASTASPRTINMSIVYIPVVVKKKKKNYIYTQLSSDVQKCRGSFWQPEWPAVHSRLRTKNRSFHFIGTDHAHMNSFELSCVWGTIEWSLWLCLIQKQKKERKKKEASVAHIERNGRQPPHPPKACSLSDWFPPLNCGNNSPRSAQQSLDTG